MINNAEQGKWHGVSAGKRPPPPPTQVMSEGLVVRNTLITTRFERELPDSKSLVTSLPHMVQVQLQVELHRTTKKGFKRHLLPSVTSQVFFLYIELENICIYLFYIYCIYIYSTTDQYLYTLQFHCSLLSDHSKKNSKLQLIYDTIIQDNM